MQVFVPYASPYLVASCLDMRRLNKQIIECRQILAAIRGESNAWKNHPCVKMYRDHTEWLEHYMFCLECYADAYRLEQLNGDSDADEVYNLSKDWSAQAYAITPPFLTEEFCKHHRDRLFTKDPEWYRDLFTHCEESYENWYFVDGELLRYANGKRITE